MEHNLIPEELEIEVFFRLPTKTLHRFKCVCKRWCSLIESPHFLKRRGKGKLLYYRKDTISKTQVVSLIDHQTAKTIEDLKWPPFVDEDVENVDSFLRVIDILGPVNGIYCIFRRLIEREVGTLTLWNPYTRHSKLIHPHLSYPFPSTLLSGFELGFDFMYPQGIHLGFGFDHATQNYKVIVISVWTPHGSDDQYGPFWDAKLYSLASNSWRTVYRYTITPFDGLLPPGLEFVPLFQFMCDYSCSHCLRNEVFHWSCYVEKVYKEDNYDDYIREILAFDMVTEAFKVMKGPPLPLKFEKKKVCVFKETIAVVDYGIYNTYHGIEIWVMMEYGVDNSWALLHSFSEGIEWNSLGITNDERIFIEDKNGQLISIKLDDEKGHIEEHGVYGMKEKASYFDFDNYNQMYGSFGILNYEETLEIL